MKITGLFLLFIVAIAACKKNDIATSPLYNQIQGTNWAKKDSTWVGVWITTSGGGYNQWKWNVHTEYISFSMPSESTYTASENNSTPAYKNSTYTEPYYCSAQSLYINNVQYNVSFPSRDQLRLWNKSDTLVYLKD